MITKEEVNKLRFSNETSRVERTISQGDMDKFQEAICAFSNDIANSRKPGYLLIGVYDDGRLSGLEVVMSGLYTQFVRFKGLDKTSEVDDERQFIGGYFEVLPKLEAFLELSIVRKRPIPVSVFREDIIFNYPYRALRELLLNAFMHRDMQGNTPIRLYEFEDRIEIMNPGGLYGNARPENFPRVNDYRNPFVAAAFKNMDYVNMFNRGVGEVQKQLKDNGNAPAIFNIDNLTVFEAIVYHRFGNKGIKSEGLSHGKGIKSEHSRKQSDKYQRVID